MRLPIPEDLEDSNGNVEVEGEDEGYRSLTSKLVVEACLNQLAGVNDWKEIIEETRKEGTVIKLAWRRGEMLEWVEDGDQEKDFTLLSGFALRQVGRDIGYSQHIFLTFTHPRINFALLLVAWTRLFSRNQTRYSLS